MTKYLPYYGMPADLTGKTALDIGTSTGFFAFECARRGARVTAIDIVDGSLFKRICNAFGLEIRYVQKSIYELDAAFGTFDLVICSAVLEHLSDIFGAVERLRSICQGQAIVATAAVEDPQCDRRAYGEFVGSRAIAGGSEYWTYWSLTATALRKMLLTAGFTRAEEVSHFTLKSEREQGGVATPYLVVKAVV